jgi:hypothetical protein
LEPAADLGERHLSTLGPSRGLAIWGSKSFWK